MNEMFYLTGRNVVIWLCIGYFVYAVYKLAGIYLKKNSSSRNNDTAQIYILLIVCTTVFLRAMDVVCISRSQFFAGLVAPYFLFITGRTIRRLMKGNQTSKKQLLTHWVITLTIAVAFVAYQLVCAD